MQIDLREEGRRRPTRHRPRGRAGRSCAWTARWSPTRSAAPSEAGHDLWYSGKHKRHGGKIQVLTDPTGYPEWVSDVEPGSVHDITAAPTHALPALYPAARDGLPTLTDKGYTGAGIGILVPTKGDLLCPDTQARNTLISALPAPRRTRERPTQTNLEGTRTCHLDPSRIGAITAATLVLLHLQLSTR